MVNFIPFRSAVPPRLEIFVSHSVSKALKKSLDILFLALDSIRLTAFLNKDIPKASSIPSIQHQIDWTRINWDRKYLFMIWIVMIWGRRLFEWRKTYRIWSRSISKRRRSTLSRRDSRLTKARSMWFLRQAWLQLRLKSTEATNLNGWRWDLSWVRRKEMARIRAQFFDLNPDVLGWTRTTP